MYVKFLVFLSCQEAGVHQALEYWFDKRFEVITKDPNQVNKEIVMHTLTSNWY